jgi:hypothetical protein
VQAWVPVLGDSLARRYSAEQAKWMAAAGQLLERHSRERIDRALEQMLVDEVVGSRALTMPAFEQVADQLIARQHARRHSPHAAPLRPHSPHMGWPEAKQHLERAIQRHGRDHRDRALAELAARDALLVRFVERVRWSVLCEQPIQFVERRYAELWTEIVDHSTQVQQEPAA